MRFLDRYPIIVTPKLKACRAFWVSHLGFEVVFEADWFVLLQADGASLAFMSPD
ncbi:MAG: glyoxalase, partial [Caulobacteraceae bacterium]